MVWFRNNGRRVPRVVERMAEEAKAGRMDRREFLAIASSLGASIAFAYGMIGRPCRARRGRRSRARAASFASPCRSSAQKDPRSYDWVELGNAARTFLEPLVRYTRQFTFEGVLLKAGM
jgi:peptide/nickel transport system substrate-binding protein